MHDNELLLKLMHVFSDPLSPCYVEDPGGRGSVCVLPSALCTAGSELFCCEISSSFSSGGQNQTKTERERRK